MSEVEALIKQDKKKTFLTILNDFGAQGWEMLFKLNDSSFLLKRSYRLNPDVLPED